MTKSHLVVLKKSYLEAILAGRKTIESRFTKNRCQPFGQVAQGDKLFLKISSGPVCATAAVSNVRSFDDITAEKLNSIRKQYNFHICGSDTYWQSKADCRYGLLLWLTDVKTIKPVRINKKDWRGWVVLSEKENFGLDR
ncbi:MAG: ASCH domain-containing protein [Sedimentisphaerales bacterium]|nr:ASCH domain-containing protein [Sedimentisphaerales bacterium]